ncbi:MAG: CHAT domain-containing protein [Bacteroidota bacterium]
MPEQYLEHLTRETNTVYNYLEPFDINDMGDVVKLENATQEMVFNAIEAWKKHKDIIMFHYGGHADGGGLMLNQEDGSSLSARAPALAELLGSLPDLQLVFLNGCSTKAQVKLLMDQGVKAVIATSEPIQDPMAVDFADRFYKNLTEGENLEESFKQARLFVEGRYDYKARQVDYRDLFWEGQEADSRQFPWELYVNNGSEEVLNWRLPTEQTKKSSLSLIDRYTCDRSEQNSRFKASFLQLKTAEKFQFYFIHGEEEQSANGLFQRFVLEQIKTSYTGAVHHRLALLEHGTTLAEAKINAKTAFFKALDLNPNQYTPDELTLQTLAKSKIAQEKDCIALMFRIYSQEWKPYTRDYLDWVTHEFCQPGQLPDSAPDFVFFVNVVYEEPTGKKGLFKRILSSSPKSKILKLLKKFPTIQFLPELPPVEKHHINRWFDKVTEDLNLKQKLIRQHFQQTEKEMAMIEVEEKLELIIEEINKQQAV